MADTWMRHMRRGAFEEAWKLSDAVLKSRASTPCWHLPRHLQYIWDGTSLEGKRVLVRCYHGLGDTIQFIRYAPLLKAMAAEVIVWAQPPLVPLLQTMQGIDQLLPLHDGTPEAEFDVDVEIMELPYIFRTTLGTLPAEVPYVHVEPMPLSSSNAPLAVGLVWHGGNWDAGRSMPFSLLAHFTQLQGIQFYIVQSKAKSAGWWGELGVYLGTSSLFEDARIIRALDVLISVDTMPAHLAGALGVPVWTLLQAEADWRWMENQDNSPWYPTMRLFRQQCPGEWEPVIERVTDALEKLRNLSKTNFYGKMPTL